MRDPLFIVVDLFCGAGGTTTGFAQAELNNASIAKVIACVNHDPKAIQSHWANHPEVVHFEEDIRTLKLRPLVDLVSNAKRQYPNAYLILWASLECTNFSKAKGGQPRDADSRTLADHLPRYISAINPDYVQIENVVEFMSWGPLDENGKPISRKNGEDWMRWRSELCSMGYYDEWKELNSANFGAYTSRNRLFGCFAKHGLPVAWPEATHTKVKLTGSVGIDLFSSALQPWKPVKEVLDFSDEGESIFTRKKPLSDKTLERIYAGLIKYVAKGDTSFISKYYSGKPAGKVDSINEPSATVTTFGNQSLVNANFLVKYNSRGKDGSYNPPSVNEPAPVVSTQNRLYLANLRFLSHYYGTSGYHSSIDNPAPTITTKARTAVVDASFLTIYNGKSLHRSINEPSPVIACNDRLSLVQAESFLMPTNFDNKPTSLEQPAPTITANRKHHYLVNPSHGGHVTSTDNPCPVIVARQDKAPLYLVLATGGQVAVEVHEGDSKVMIDIKKFMSAFGIVDIKMRMLRVAELLKIQGFPPGYYLEGNQADQKKFIGNSVHPKVVKVWTETLALPLFSKTYKVA